MPKLFALSQLGGVGFIVLPDFADQFSSSRVLLLELDTFSDLIGHSDKAVWLHDNKSERIHQIEESNATVHQSLIQSVAVNESLIVVTTLKSVGLWRWSERTVTKVAMVTPFT